LIIVTCERRILLIFTANPNCIPFEYSTPRAPTRPPWQFHRRVRFWKRNVNDPQLIANFTR